MAEWLDLGKPITLDDLRCLRGASGAGSLDDLAACFDDDDQLGDHDCACVVCADERKSEAGQSGATAAREVSSGDVATPPGAFAEPDDDDSSGRAG